jgi:hypothetical protein
LAQPTDFNAEAAKLHVRGSAWNKDHLRALRVVPLDDCRYGRNATTIEKWASIRFPCCCMCPNSPTREMISHWGGANPIIVLKKLIRYWIQQWEETVESR